MTEPPIDVNDVQVQGNPGQIDVGSLDVGGANITMEGTGGAPKAGGIPTDEATLLEAWTNEYGNFSTAKQGGEKGDPIPDFKP